MITAKKTDTASELETKIREIIKTTDGLTFGYIGNFERWGDDRKLLVWVDGLTDRDVYGENTTHPNNKFALWSAPAKSLDIEAFYRLRSAARTFKIGRQSAANQA